MFARRKVCSSARLPPSQQAPQADPERSLRDRSGRRAGALVLMSCVAAVLVVLFAVPAVGVAAVGAPAWSVQSVGVPTSFSGSIGAAGYTIELTNVGSASSSGVYTLVDRLPPGLTAAGASWSSNNSRRAQESEEGHCTVEEAGTLVTCTREEPVPALTPVLMMIGISVTVDPGVQGTEVNHVEVSGGGASATATADTSTVVTPGSLVPPLRFGLAEFGLSLPGSSGAPDTVAGSHPGGLSTTFAFDTAWQVPQTPGKSVASYPVGQVKEIVTELPPGVVGDAIATPTCPLYLVTNKTGFDSPACPDATRVGWLTLVEGGQESPNTDLSIFNVPPERGFAAEFAVYLPSLQRAVNLYAKLVGTGANTRVLVFSQPQNRVPEISSISATFFGDPAVADSSPLAHVPFLTAPSDCSASGFTARLYVDSWEEPAATRPDGEPVDLSEPTWKSAQSPLPAVTGCENLQFHPSLSLQPTATGPDAPSGLNVNLQVPQNEDPNGLATPPLKDVTVTLPEGLDVSPSSATGLQACSDAQFGLASDPNQPGSCPAASQIGTVLVHTPLLEEAIPGQVFLGAPECGPCSAADAQSGRMVRLFVQLHSDRYGITLKAPGTVSLNPVTGQLVSTFKELPQQPFSDLEFTFKEGPRAPLATPSGCGQHATSTSLTPWSTPWTPTVTSGSAFAISGCAGNPFAPSFHAGTTVNQAGAYSPLQLSFSRSDPEQQFSALEATLPPGVLAKLAGVAHCGEAELAAARAQSGECPASSQIGTVTVAAGPGTQPFTTTGRVYLTGAYNGGPFGEAVVVPAVAGPFNLGNVVVRGSIRINPTTAQGSVVSDAFPTILDGVPLQVRSVQVSLERPGFTFNASSCTPQGFTGRLISTAGGSAPLSSRYQAAGCQSMPFHPHFTASTAGQTSKVNGASLHVKITANGGPDHPSGTEEANVAKVELTIPRVLPSRLSTLQKACTEKQFNANPAGCPKESNIATAIVRTPLLANPLAGPVYFVSHGGAAFPDTEIVLQGEGVRLLLDGHTQIKGGVTYSRFETVPDAPFSSFEFVAPEGPYSIFGANGNLCALTKTVTTTKKVTRKVHGHSRRVTVKVKKTISATLEMPTKITAQNGAVLNQNTKVAVTGCPTAKTARKAAKSNRRGR
jgi:hypothetical protein